jgi:hypothetical protein
MARRPASARDLASAAGLGALAAIYLVLNRHYPLDSLATPGPGVFPLAAGALALGLAGIQIVRTAWIVDGATTPTTGGEAGAPSEDRAGRSWRRTVATAALLVAGAAAIGPLGFFPAAFGLVVGACRLLGGRGWAGPIALGLGATAAIWLIFVAWLGVPLPAGLVH